MQTILISPGQQKIKKPTVTAVKELILETKGKHV